MASKKSGVPSPESIARADRQRIAFEEGQKAMADIQQQAVAVRENMARLRALREAKEATKQKIEVTAGALKPKAKRKRRVYR
jgi:hypothetical protein